MTEPKPDRHVVACNVIRDTASISAGAKAYVVLLNPGGGHDRIEILVRTRSGRWVRKWHGIKALDNFRVKTLPPEHFLYSDERLIDDGPMWAGYASLPEIVEKLADARARVLERAGA